MYATVRWDIEGALSFQHHYFMLNAAVFAVVNFVTTKCIVSDCTTLQPVAVSSFSTVDMSITRFAQVGMALVMLSLD